MNYDVNMMNCMGDMMWPMGLMLLFIVGLLILAAAALFKFLLGGKK